MNLSEVLKFVDRNSVARLVDDENEDRDDPDIALGDENVLQFTIDFAAKKFLSQVISKLV